MSVYQESECNVCPVRCRAGVFSGSAHAGQTCPAGREDHDWRKTGESEERSGVECITVDATTTVTAVNAGTLLLACFGCRSAPCLLEVTGPVTSLPCVLGIERPPSRVVKWQRVVS